MFVPDLHPLRETVSVVLDVDNHLQVDECFGLPHEYRTLISDIKYNKRAQVNKPTTHNLRGFDGNILYFVFK